jgi:hypothetical protein
VHIVERHDGRLAGRQPLQQRPDRVLRPVAVITQALLPYGLLTAEGREHRRQLSERLGAQRGMQSLADRPQIVVAGVAEHRKRQVPLELCGPASQHQVSARPGAPGQLLEQAGLADARLAGNLHEPRPAGPEAVQAPVELSQLVFPADQDARSLAGGWGTRFPS